MSIKIALAGNPNSGKTTMFNDLTGSQQYVGNWPGVTVEKKEGKLKGRSDVIIQDLPGIYSLSSYSPEEVITRNYLVREKPDAVINIVDATNIERNLYLTTQIIEIGVPVIIALNMIDIVRKNGDVINLKGLEDALGCRVMETSALRGQGSLEAATAASDLVSSTRPVHIPPVFNGSVEHAIAHIEESIQDKVPERYLRWYAIKIFERDAVILEELDLPQELEQHLEVHIRECEKEMDDDSESIIISQRYNYVEKLVAKCVIRNIKAGGTDSDKIDRILTNRILALPIFAVVMFLVYYLSISTVGGFVTEFTNETLFGDWIYMPLSAWLDQVGASPVFSGLLLDGIIGGVGAVLGFVPQMTVLFLMLSLLEDVGYMSRVAFIMDRIFRKFGLSGKSFIPMLVGSGCSVPGIMASRTIENDRDRRMTIMTTSFIPCGAKMPIVALFAGALFGGSGLVAVSAYFIGITAVVLSGLMLKKTRPFAGDVAPFIMELPPYHMPTLSNIARTTGERAWSFVKRAGTVILLSSVILWFLQSFGAEDGRLMMVPDNNTSLLSSIGGWVAPFFAPLGFGNWQAAVATFTGLIAKENVVSTFGVLYGFAEVAEDGTQIWSRLAADFTGLTAYSFLIFNLLCAPCIATIATIKKEMNSIHWTLATIGYMTGFAYGAALMVYQFGLLLQGGSLTFWSAVAFLLMGMLLFLLFRPKPREHVHYEPMAYGSGCQGACPAGCKGCPSNTANRKHRGRNRI
ncbi:MAG: ferrous iron transport protein B [Eubacteriales bacterium]|jgi:ferrous iron transport protein B|nr:ferrous iron transport protein B [Eubacteriales bacterium]MDD3290250.1 ferrous iron transport protein B [Eubacteriales bacterium]MDD3863173.1 ferrous iron transport protein B [Eubacteriales bacterium]MDD4444569.1 ferrous iron transport protein B [Eubacteriales bacterium]